MSDRRKFLKIGLAGTALAIANPFKAAEQIGAKQKGSRVNSPVVISTWNHGLAANDEAWKVLENGGKAIDAVEKGVMITEVDLTNRSVGIGGMPDRDGHVTLDACIMDHESRCGSVAFLEGIVHPISVARAVMERTQHVMLVGEGAKKFALAQGFDTFKTPIPEVKKIWKAWRKEHKDDYFKPEINHENHDTIGMLALDAQGNISGSCTTSGWAYKMHGRVGDSPIIGAGLFVDNEIGGAVATGLGEAIVRIAGSHTVVELMRHGYTPQAACEEAVQRIISKHKDLTNLQCGFLAIDKNGNVGAHSVYAGFNYAFRSADHAKLMDASFDRNW
ncbi:MAG: N(4)-(beta-N-acetylglucosaminyl)-L-asparaginase [Bacteroidota bacterium]